MDISTVFINAGGNMNFLDYLNIDEETKNKLEKVYGFKKQIIDLANSQKIQLIIAVAAMLDLIVDMYVQNGVQNELSLDEIKKTIYTRFVKRIDLEVNIEECYEEVVKKIKALQRC